MLTKFKFYLENEKRRSPYTVLSYVNSLKTFRRHIKKDYLLAGETDLRSYKRRLIMRKLKNTTINSILAGLKSFYEWAILEGKLAKNPVTKDLFMKTPPPPIVEIPDREDIDKMLGAIQYRLDQKTLKIQMRRDLVLQKLKDEILEREKRVFSEAAKCARLKTLRDKFLVSALASSGIRIGELLKLTVDDIGGDGSIRVRQGKGNKDRYAFMDDRSRQIYGEYREMLKEKGIKKLYALTYRQAWNLIKKCAERAGIAKNLHPHSLRHFFITEMGKRGMSDSDLSKFSGHKNVNVLARYKNYSKEMQKQIYERYQSDAGKK